MAYIYPLKASDMKTIERRDYAKYLKGTLKMKLTDGTKLPFCLVLNHVYPKSTLVKSIQLPFFLFGPEKSRAEWTSFKKDGGGDNQDKKPIVMIIGTCIRKGNHITLNINTKGDKTKIPEKHIKILQRVITATKLGLTIDIKDEESSDGVVGVAAGVGATTDQKEPKKETTTDTPTSDKEQKTPEQQEKTEQKGKPKPTEEQKEKLVQKYKKDKQEDAKQINEHLKELEELFADDAIKKVTKNIKHGRTTGSDSKTVKELIELYSSTEKLYKGTAKQVQGKFQKSYKKLAENKKQLIMLAKATEQSKKSFAKYYADKYYQKKFGKDATEQQVQVMQGILMDSIKMNNKRRKKATQTLLFRETYLVLLEKGIRDFNVKFVNKSLQQQLS